jgi:hypothetical protein
LRRSRSCEDYANSSAGGARQGTVLLAEDAGHARILVVDWAGQRIHIVTDRGVTLKAGDTIRPSIDAGRVVTWELPAHVIPARGEA